MQWLIFSLFKNFKTLCFTFLFLYFPFIPAVIISLFRSRRSNIWQKNFHSFICRTTYIFVILECFNAEVFFLMSNEFLLLHMAKSRGQNYPLSLNVCIFYAKSMERPPQIEPNYTAAQTKINLHSCLEFFFKTWNLISHLMKKQ